MTDRTTEEARKAFIAVANDRGYDTAHAYDTDRSRWVFFNPMTADLWAFWQAALHWQAEQQKREAGFDDPDWSAWIGTMIGCYLGFAVDDERNTAIAAIIERRLWALKRLSSLPQAPQGEQ